MSVPNISRRQFVGGLAASTVLTPNRGLACGRASIPVVRIAKFSPFHKLDPADYYDDDEIIIRATIASLTRPAAASSSAQTGWVPYLAELKVQRDGEERKILFRLQKNIVWSKLGGRAVTAHDVKFSLERIKKEGREDIKERWEDLDGVEILDRYSGFLHLRRKNVSLWQEAFPRACASIVHDGFSFWDPTEADASGPYYIDEMEPNYKVVLRCNPQWKGRSVKINTAIFRIFNSYDVALSAFENDEIDIIEIKGEKFGTRYQRYFKEFSGAFLVEVKDGPRISYLGMNTKNEHLSDTNARRAAQAAVDPDAIAKIAFPEGGAAPAYGLVPSFLPEYRRDPDVTFDPARAQVLLAQSQFPGGFVTTLHIPPWLGGAYDRMAKMLAEMLGRIGIKLEFVKDSPWRPRDQRPVGLFIGRTPNVRDPSYAFLEFLSDARFNITGYRSAKFDELYDLGLRVEGDKRAAVYMEIQTILDEAAVAVPIIQERVAWLYKDKLEPAFTKSGELGDLVDFG